MASESTPPAQGGGNTKYIIIALLLLLGAAAGVYFMTKQPPPPPPAPPVVPQDAGAPPPREQVYIPPVEPDAGQQVDAGRHVKRIVVTRYVDNGDWECSGDVPASSIQSIIAENRRQVRNCYERALKRNNQLQGSLVLSLKLGRTGHVEGTRVGGSIGDQEVFSCVRALAERWQFPAPSGGACAVVRAPFNFTPQGQ